MTEFVNSEENPSKEVEICRICGEASEHGQILFHFNQDIQKLAVKICSYISIKLKHLRIYPNWICPGCHLQFESTNQFFELIRNGQRLLGEKFGVQPRRGRKPKRHKGVQTKEDVPSSSDVETTENGRKRSAKTPGRLQDSMQGDELENLYSEIGVTRKSAKRASKTKLIAHIENQDGATLGEMLAIPRNPLRTCTRYQCDVCKERFVQDVAFFKHVATHKNILYECTECEGCFQTKAAFDEHQVAENHGGLGIIEMPFVEPPPPSKEKEEEPTEKPPPRRFVCIKCNKNFPTKMSMKRHQVTHSQNRPFKCDVCGTAFKLSTVLEIHKTSHTGLRAFKCNRCPKDFIHRQTLVAHLRSHDGLRPYLCTICKKSFFQLGALKEHKRIHTGERPYVCLICGTSFRTSSACHSHQRVHTIATDRRPEPVEYENIRKTHTCKACGKLFSQRSAMMKHLRTHTGEKPYVCHLCPRRFSDPSNFKKHKKVHEVQKETRKAKAAAILKQSLTHVSSTNSDPDPDGMLSMPSNFLPHTRSLMDILDDENEDRNNKAWGLRRESIDPVFTEISQDENSLMLPQQSIANQLVCISYQDPMNPVSNKTTFYVVN